MHRANDLAGDLRARPASLADATLRGGPAARVLCIGADDFGLREGVNQAILALLDAGRLQSVGCRVGGAAWRQGAMALRHRDRRRFDACLHLDLVHRPLGADSRHHLSHLAFASMAQPARRDALRREIDAQLEAFEAGLGGAPAHVDGPAQVLQLPVVRETLRLALDDRYGAARPAVRSARVVHGAPWTAPQVLLLDGPGADGTPAPGAAAAPAHGRLIGAYDFEGGEPRFRDLVHEWLRTARGRDLLMCHPGLGWDAADRMAAARQAEFAVLSDPTLPDLLRAEGLTLRPASRWWSPAAT